MLKGTKKLSTSGKVYTINIDCHPATFAKALRYVRNGNLGDPTKWLNIRRSFGVYVIDASEEIDNGKVSYLYRILPFAID